MYFSLFKTCLWFQIPSTDSRFPSFSDWFCSPLLWFCCSFANLPSLNKCSSLIFVGKLKMKISWKNSLIIELWWSIKQFFSSVLERHVHQNYLWKQANSHKRRQTQTSYDEVGNEKGTPFARGWKSGNCKSPARQRMILSFFSLILTENWRKLSSESPKNS